MANPQQQADLISALINDLINDNFDAIVEQARATPSIPFQFSVEAVNSIIESSSESTQQLIDESAQDFATVSDDVVTSGAEDSKPLVDDINTFYIRKLLNDAAYSIHSSTIAPQVNPSERQDVVDQSLTTTLLVVSSVIAAQMYASNALLREPLALDSGVRYYRYVTVGDDKVRPEHAARNGAIFVYGQQRDNADVPGLENNCRCVDVPISNEEAMANPQDFFYPEDAPVQNSSKKTKMMSGIKLNGKAMAYYEVADVELGEFDFLKFIIDMQLQENKDQDIDLSISSYGGSMYDGLAIYSYLKSLPNNVNVEIYGHAQSAGSLIAMAGDNVSMGNSDLMMIHNPWTSVAGDYQDFSKLAEELEVNADAVARAYSNKTGLSVDNIRQIMDKGIDMSAEKALELGFINEIRGGSMSENKESVKKDDIDMSEFEALKAENETLKAQNDALNAKLNSAKSEDELRKEVEKEFLSRAVKTNSAITEFKDIGIEATGESELDVFMSGLKTMGVENSDKLDIKSMRAVFNSVKKFHVQENATDEVETLMSAKKETDDEKGSALLASELMMKKRGVDNG